jgi:hypothetical protein
MLLLFAGLLTLSRTPPNEVTVRNPGSNLAELYTHYEADSSLHGSPPPRPSHMSDTDASPGASGTASFAGARAATAPAAVAASEPPSTAAGTAGIPRVDSRELPLLATIERELKRAPPPEVHTLLAEYRRGADRAALIEHVQRNFPGDLSLRVVVLRWIDDVRPDAGQAPVPKARAPAPGTGPTWVTPIRPRH